jgi:hypothetical protein
VLSRCFTTASSGGREKSSVSAAKYLIKTSLEASGWVQGAARGLGAEVWRTHREPGAINYLIAVRRFFRYEVDGDEIIVQEFRVRLDDEPEYQWRALLNRASDFGDSARWRAYEAARVASGKISTPRLRREVDDEMKVALSNFWFGARVPDDIDQLFGGLTLDYFVGPRTIDEFMAERGSSTAS